MGKFTKIPQTTFKELQMDAGLLLKTFDPETATAPQDKDIICVTSGGINATCVPTYSDWGEDIDNCPNGMLELMHLDGWECTMGFTALTMNTELVRMSLGAADVTASSGLIKPRRDLKDTDFGDIWWVGDLMGGGLVAIKLKNALSSGGFSLQTTKNGKGQITVELAGHVSINEQDEMPMEFYIKGSEE